MRRSERRLRDEAEAYKTPEKPKTSIVAKQIKSQVASNVNNNNTNNRSQVTSTLPKSVYNSPYKSNRQLASEIRDEIMARSVERSQAFRDVQRERSRRRMNELNELEKERNRSTQRLKSLSRLRELDDRYWSPVRGWVYREPTHLLAESLARQTELEREALRSSLGLNYESALKKSYALNSALKSTAEKSYVDSLTASRRKSLGFMRDRELSPVNQSKMIVNLNDSIIDNKLLEEKRIALAMRYDFCLMEMFTLLDVKQMNYLNLADFERFCYDNAISLNSEDLCVIIDRYDKDRDGTLGFGEFCDIFLPTSPEYRRTMQDRIQRGIYSFYDFTAVTQNCVRDLLRSIVTVEENFEDNKFRLSDGRVLTSDEIFAFLDKWKTGYVTLSEFTSK